MCGTARKDLFFSFSPEICQHPMWSFRIIVVFLFGLGFLSTAEAQPYERTIRDTVALSSGTVSVENESGSVTVSSWERDAVAYRARVSGEQVEEAVEETRIDIHRTDEVLTFATNYDEVDGHWNFGPKSFGYVKTHPDIHYTLRVPKSASLRIADEESDIDVSGLSGSLRIDTHEGSVRVTDQQGRADMSSHEGRMILQAMAGDLIVNTQEGAVTIDDLRGRLDLRTHEGRADVHVRSLEDLVVETHEGDVTLVLPSSAGFNLSTGLGEDAELRSAFALDSVRTGDHNYHGPVQEGGPLLRIDTREGRVALQSR